MKYKTFRNLVLAAALTAIAGGTWWAFTSDPKPPLPPQPAASSQTATENAEAERSAEPTHEPPAVLFLVATLGKPANVSKLKDALGSSGPKVNVYAEKGVWARAKVDLDRDEKWDEKWSLESVGIKRRISSNDDDSTYDQEALWHNGAWMGEPR